MKNRMKQLGLAVMFFIVAGCSQQVPARQQTAPSTNIAPVMAGEQSSSPQQQNQQTVSILNYAFDPATVSVKSGTTVTWVNNDPVPHKIVSGTGSADGLFGSNNLAQGESYSFTFATAGTFDYFCQIHPSMKGRIVVTQ